MDDKEIHQDIGGLKEFKSWAKCEFDRLHAKMDEALSFKWKVVGASGTISLLVALVVEYFSNKRG